LGKEDLFGELTNHRWWEAITNKDHLRELRSMKGLYKEGKEEQEKQARKN
jgi:hypothetical protein